VNHKDPQKSQSVSPARHSPRFREREEHVASTGKKPEEVLKDWEKMSFDEQHQFLQLRRAQEQTSKSKPKKGQRMIIDASEIGNHCNHGWRAVFQFQDGRVQVEYDGEEESVEVGVRD
jgi:hypothetical protein